MSSKLQKFDSGQETWARFVLRLENFFVREGISRPVAADAQDGKIQKRRAWLLDSLGIDLFNKLNDLHGQDAVVGMTYDQIRMNVEAIVNPAPLILQERLKFSRRKQQHGESATDFMLALRNLAIKCTFNADSVAPSTVELARLRDQFVYGVGNGELQKRLLQEQALTATTAVEIAQRFEQAETTAQSWNQGPFSSTVSAISSGKKKSSSVHSQASARSRRSTTATTSKYLCYRCGDHVVSGHKCKAVNAECKNCGIVGHFSKICQKGQRLGPKGHFKKSKDRVAEVEVGEEWDHSSQESVCIIKATSVDHHSSVVQGSAAKPPGSKGSCYWCGEVYSPDHKCKAIGETCRSCGKVGHFAKVCRQGRQAVKQKGKFRKPKNTVAEIDLENTSEQGSEESAAADKVRNADSQLTAPKFFIRLGLNSQKVKFVWGTGSGATLINGDIWRQLGKPALSPCALTFSSYSGHHIPVIGTARVDVRFKRKIFKNLRLVVVGGQTFPIVGRSWTVQLGITQAHSHTEDVSSVDGELFDIVEIISAVVEKEVKPTKATERLVRTFKNVVGLKKFSLSVITYRLGMVSAHIPQHTTSYDWLCASGNVAGSSSSVTIGRRFQSQKMKKRSRHGEPSNLRKGKCWVLNLAPKRRV